MNKQMIIGFVVGGVIATAGGAYAMRSTGPKMANIVSVTPITVGMEQEYVEVTRVNKRIDPNAPQIAEVLNAQPVRVEGQTRQVCEDQVVTRQAPVKDQNQIAGTATGAVIGGLLGNQVGGGNGKKAATVLGAIAGGVVGKNVQANRQQQQTYQTTEQVCNTVQDASRITGYDVTVSVNGQTQNISMAYKPQGQLPVINGQVITDKAQIQQWKNTPQPVIYDVFYTYNNQPQQVQLDYAPNIGERLPVEYGQVLTTPEQLANLQARASAVVAYRVTYQLNDTIGEARMEQHPVGNLLPIKNGQPVITASAAQ